MKTVFAKSLVLGTKDYFSDTLLVFRIQLTHLCYTRYINLELSNIDVSDNIF